MILQRENSFLQKSVVIFFGAVFLILFSSTVIFSQKNEFGSVSGIIADESTGKPIGNVNVYVSHSTIGTTTNGNGEFLIRKIPVGMVRIIVSYVGYEVVTEEVQIKANFRNELNFKLRKKIYQLPTVIVDSEDAEKWRRNYQIFFAEFIGTSDNSKECTIEDPYDLEFTTDDDGALIATTTKPLEIINKALGYKITYFLESFRNFGRSTKFKGYPVYEELEPSGEQEAEKWKENRIKMYCGSFRHFLFTASRDYDNFLKGAHKQSDEKNDTVKTLLEREGFKVMAIKKIDVGFFKYEKYTSLSAPGFIYSSPDPNEKILSFPDRIQVTYLREKEDEKYLRFIGVFRDPDFQQSIIKLHSLKVRFNSKGYSYDDFQIETLGYWAFERLGDLLPFDYSVPESVLLSYHF